MSRCREHGVTQPCPLCAQGAWPLRDLNAVADFAGNPVDRPDGLVPGRRYVRLSEVVRHMLAMPGAHFHGSFRPYSEML